MRGLALAVLTLTAFPIAAGIETHTLASCAENTHRIWLEEGDFLEGHVRQDEIDLVVRIADPAGIELRRIDHHNTMGVREQFAVVAPRTGEYRLTVTARDSTLAAKYTLDVRPIRFASERDVDVSTAAFLIDAAAANENDRSRILTVTSALELCRSGASSECEAHALRALGHAHWYAGLELRRGRDYLREALAIHEASGDIWHQADTLNDLGVLSDAIGDVLEARDYYERVVALTTGDKSPIHLHHLAAVYWQLGELQRAFDLEQQALDDWKLRRDHIGLAYGNGAMGDFHRQLGEPEEALRYDRESLRLWTRTGWHGGIAASHLRIGQDQEALGDRDAAMRSYRQASEHFTVDKNSLGQARTQQRIGATLLARGEREAALLAFQRALELFAIAGASDADARKGIGDVHAARGDVAGARESYELALAAFRASGNQRAELDVRLAVARVELRGGALAEAQAILDDAIGTLESIRYNLLSTEQRASYLAARQTFYDLSVDVRMRLHAREPQAGHDRAALAASERGRARALLDVIGSNRIALDAIDPQLSAREERLRSRVVGKAAAIARRSPNRNDAESALLSDELAALLREYRQVEADVRRVSPGNGLESQPSSVEEIQKQLDPDVLLIEYSLGESRSYVWAITSRRVVSMALAPRGTIEDAALQVAKLLPHSRKREGETQARRAAGRLAKLILEPIASHLQGRRLVVVADGALQYVPFAVLPRPGTPSRPLLEDHEITYLPSASVIAELRSHPPSRAEGSVVVLADPVLSGTDPRVSRAKLASVKPASDLMRSLKDFQGFSFERLPYTRAEAIEIARLAGPGRALQALDFAASRERATSGELSRYRIVHFATHGLINTRHPELSGLVLSLVDAQGQPQDGFLPLLDIYKLRLDAELVVLSACRTALGRDLRREGLVGLARGFMHAGSPRVVASVWDVRDSATAELMTRFYRNLLRGGMRPSAALRDAQLSMLREPRWSAPFYWGAFVLQGEWR